MRLVQTCGACPEQYDVFDAYGEQIGYLRLRHGHFAAHWGNPSGRVLYTASPRGDGVFEPDERDLYLGRALSAIAHHAGHEDDREITAMVTRAISRMEYTG